MKFRLGQRVHSVNTGYPTYGTIQGIISSEFFFKTTGANPNTEHFWDKFPNWRNMPVYYVKYDKPQKPLTQKEYIEASIKAGRGYSDKDYAAIPSVSMASFPELDLFAPEYN
jgi:hypothetical protein